MNKRYNMSILDIVLITLISFILGMSAIVVIVAIVGQPAHIPVCHAITEDSDITDCSYQNGTWSTK